MHLLYKRIRNLHIPVDLQMHLLSHTILPVLQYGCKVWGFQNIKMLENVQNRFLRSIGKLRKSTQIYMVYAEIGTKPTDTYIKSRMIGYWLTIINSENSKLSKIIHNIMYSESLQGGTYKWLNHMKQILISVGRVELFSQDHINNPKAIKVKITKTLNDLFIQEWNTKTAMSSKGRENLEFEPYLKILSKSSHILLIKFRTANHKLPVETERWKNIPLAERKCTLCNKNDIGNEFHYLLICPYFATERTRLLKPYFFQRPNIFKYISLLYK